MKQINLCPRCGGELKEINDKYQCVYCGAIFEKEKVVDIKEELNKAIDELKQEKVANLRSRLWEAVHEKYQSKEKIVSISREIRNYLPGDFLACFYEYVNTKSVKEINDYLSDIDISNNYEYIDLIIEYMLDIVEEGNLLTLNNLIEKAYKANNLELFEKYSTDLSKEAVKLDEGIYDLDLTRDVFIAYSSKDMKYVEEVVETLEKEGISCFVAMRNLRHGKGAVENYNEGLKKAIKNSKIFLFVSTPNSRSRNCDALTVEIPFIKEWDTNNAPAEYRIDYNKIPVKYKKPRIHLVIGEKPGDGPADRRVNEFFNGIEWCYSASNAANIAYDLLDQNIVIEDEVEKLRKQLEELTRKQEEAEKEKLRKEAEELKRKQEEIEKERIEKEAAETKKKAEEETLRIKQNIEALKEKSDRKQKNDEEIIRKEKDAHEAKKKAEEEAERKRKIEDEGKKETIRKDGFYRERNYIYFGSYYQSNDKDKEPIKWKILKEENGKALILTDKIIDVSKFDNDSNNYEKSYIREWLNKDFYNKAFNDIEKNKILTTLVDNSLASTMDEDNEFVCNDTNDKVFLLSVKETNLYFKNNEEKQAIGTDYTKEKGLIGSDEWFYKGKCEWFLRSPYDCFEDEDATDIYLVDEHGEIGTGQVYFVYYGVRPALWIDLSKKAYIKIGIKKNVEEKIQGQKTNSKPYTRDGNDIYFGSYFQSNDKEKEPIKWNILKEENGKALIITEKLIDAVKFDDKLNNYEKSYIRNWLNNDFYNNAFDGIEKDIIDVTLVDNSYKSTTDESNKYLCDNTNDKVFLLSVKEANEYFNNDEKRKAEGTGYAKNKGLYVSNGIYGRSKGYSSWLLRSPYCDDPRFARSISPSGNFDYNIECHTSSGIRPALWIELSNQEVTEISTDVKAKESTKIHEEPLEPYKRDGNNIYFGSYFQSNDKEKEPIKWNILKEENGKALIITDKIIDALKFNNKTSQFSFGVDNNYEKSYIRNWLNNDFYNNAFDGIEKDIIDVTLVDNSYKSTTDESNKYLCDNTNDKVFLLSTKEANTYYKNDEERLAAGTEYAKMNGLWVYPETKKSCWWLRTPYFYYSYYTRIVEATGHIGCNGVNTNVYGVRPALWVDLSKLGGIESNVKIKNV